MNLPESELNKITEAVHQGIVASKGAESNMWGDFKNNLKEIQTVLEKNAENTQDYRNIVDAHMKNSNDFMLRVEPMLLSYEKDNAESIAISGLAKKWGVRLGLTASIILSLYTIREFIIKFFIK